tara:strand:+ start:361 stop:735 length:375 start_codon:yes stop_codon:yes gene_type:complete
MTKALKRLSISDLIRADVLTVGNAALFRFDDGTISQFACFAEGELSISTDGINQKLSVVTCRNGDWSRQYFNIGGKSVFHIYFVAGRGWTSRIDAGLRFESDPVVRPVKIPRKGGVFQSFAVVA